MCISICSHFLDSADMDAMLRRDPRELLQAARVRIFAELVLGMCPAEFEHAVDQAYDILRKCSVLNYWESRRSNQLQTLIDEAQQ
jgi:hypothetical protein